MINVQRRHTTRPTLTRYWMKSSMEKAKMHQKRIEKEVDNKLRDGDIDFIKELERNKNSTHSLGVDVHECYELVSMCINLGANIDKLDGYAQSVLKLSQRNGFPAIEELLMMNLLKTELGQRIENTTNDIARKQGITHSFNRILNDLPQQTNASELE
eukprot:1006620_1